MKSKIVYGIAGLLAFLPLSILVVIQSIFALEASYDTTLTVDANQMQIVDIIVYDAYNHNISNVIEETDADGKPILWSIIEATDKYIIIDFHGGKINDARVDISAIQFELEDNTVTELLHGIVYLKFKNVAMSPTSPNWARDAWLRDFIEDLNELYVLYYEQPQGTISFVWVKIITASIGTLLGIVTVVLVILRKSTKALVKRYWRIAVLVALIEGTIILGLITWIVADIFQVFAAATIGWVLFLGTEKLARIKGYLETATTTGELPEVLPLEVRADIQASVDSILAKYRK